MLRNATRNKRSMHTAVQRCIVHVKASSEASSSPPSPLPMPTSGLRLVRVAQELESGERVSVREGEATYTVRLVTSSGRGARLTHPDAGILFGLVGRNGDAFMHRVDPCDDHEGVSHRRFQEGMVDEVTLLAPDIGPVAEFWVAPEAGTWELEEATVSCTKGGVVDTAVYRFQCKSKIGEDGVVPAAQMKPLPPGAKLDSYGNVSKTAGLSSAEIAAVRAADMAQYELLKRRLLFVTAMLVIAGSGMAFLLSGEDSAIRFGLGGASGMIYLMLLQKGVDTLQVKEPRLDSLDFVDTPKRFSFLGSPMTRLVFVGMLVYTFFHAVSGQAKSAVMVREMLEAGLGFMMYKLSILFVALSGEPSTDPEHN